METRKLIEEIDLDFDRKTETYRLKPRAKSIGAWILLLAFAAPFSFCAGVILAGIVTTALGVPVTDNEICLGAFAALAGIIYGNL
jgi:hypothetical protein